MDIFCDYTLRESMLQMWWAFGRVSPWYWGDVALQLHGAAMMEDNWSEAQNIMMLRDIARMYQKEHVDSL